ncbi:hypothetical protein DPMN_168469 [Dreissena polymorpha]|uniref:Uncharacterized protein n=1 Tax=Dreissena polymorpha TaxID=45954 RepID=A0A9D4F1U8_DREPO|nr:hypothetical protein DPMN_168469 [Dreissena polymorpha]
MCAICNGATDGKHWETYFATDRPSHSNIEMLHAHGADSQSSFPGAVYFSYMHDDIFSVSKKLCHRRTVDTCGPWCFSDSDRLYTSWLNDTSLDLKTIDLLCKNIFQSTYISKFIKQLSIFYKNVLRYICSDEFNIDKHKNCIQDNSLQKETPNFHEFTMLIDWDSVVASGRAMYNQACEILPNGTMVSGLVLLYFCP